MDNLYRDFILEHYREPHNRGVLDPHDLHFADSNPTCGDELSMTLRLDPAGSGSPTSPSTVAAARSARHRPRS